MDIDKTDKIPKKTENLDFKSYLLNSKSTAYYSLLYSKYKVF